MHSCRPRWICVANRRSDRQARCRRWNCADCVAIWKMDTNTFGGKLSVTHPFNSRPLFRSKSQCRGVQTESFSAAVCSSSFRVILYHSQAKCKHTNVFCVCPRVSSQLDTPTCNTSTGASISYIFQHKGAVVLPLPDPSHYL